MTDFNPQDRKQQIQRWIGTVNNLPPLPAVVQEAVALLDSSRSSATDVARVISKDEAITAKILRVVNSAYYGIPGKVTTVSHAVTLLGFEQLRLLIMGVVLLQQFRTRDAKTEPHRKAMWEHSSACARWSRELARASRYQPAEEAFVAGLLHDIGKVALIASSPGEFAESVALSQTGGIATYEAEDRTVRFNHVEAGKLICDRWRLPSVVRHAVALHHCPWPLPIDDYDEDPARLQHLLAVVQIANSAAKQSLAEQPPDDDTETTIAISPQDLVERLYQVNSLLEY